MLFTRNNSTIRSRISSVPSPPRVVPVSAGNESHRVEEIEQAAERTQDFVDCEQNRDEISNVPVSCHRSKRHINRQA